MKKILFFTLFGIILLVAGIISIYIFFERLNQNSYPWLLFLSVAFFGGCAFFFFKATNQQTQNNNKQEPIIEKTEKKSILERNNELINEYRNTSNTRDKLKVLESASKKNII